MESVIKNDTNSNQKRLQKKEVIVATCGGFDPVHIGHVRLFEEARKLGDKLVVILNGDTWVYRKKGFVFMPAVERKEILLALRAVDEVIIYNSEASHVASALKELTPDIFAKGGDRDKVSTPSVEIRMCQEIGCRVVYNVGGGKVQSSSNLVKKSLKQGGLDKSATDGLNG